MFYAHSSQKTNLRYEIVIHIPHESISIWHIKRKSQVQNGYVKADPSFVFLIN